MLNIIENCACTIALSSVSTTSFDSATENLLIWLVFQDCKRSNRLNPEPDFHSEPLKVIQLFMQQRCFEAYQIKNKKKNVIF